MQQDIRNNHTKTITLLCYLPGGRGKVINYREGNKVMYYLREGGDAPTYLYIELDENDVGTNIYVVNSQT